MQVSMDSSSTTNKEKGGAQLALELNSPLFRNIRNILHDKFVDYRIYSDPYQIAMMSGAMMVIKFIDDVADGFISVEGREVKKQ